MERVVLWTPRVICLLFIAFVSMFALDVFGEGRGFWDTVVALTMHLIPSFVMIAALVLAWRWQWVGTVVFTFAAIFFFLIVRALWWGKAMFAVPCLLVALLFLVSWHTKNRL